MFIARADAAFAELKGNNEVVAQDVAATKDLAAARAVRKLFRDPKVKGKRSVANLTVRIYVIKRDA